MELTKTDLVTGIITSERAFFWSDVAALHSTNDISESYHAGIIKVSESIDTFTQNGSNCNIGKIYQIIIKADGFQPLYGGQQAQLPEQIARKKACITLENSDSLCFLYNCLLALNMDKDERKFHRKPQMLLQYRDQLDMTGIKYPVSLKQIDLLERLNPHIAVTIIGCEKEANGTYTMFPMRVSKRLTDATFKIDMLLHDSHYFLIKKLDTLLSNKKVEHKRYVCRNCFHRFSRSDLLTRHEGDCLSNKPMVINLPQEDDNVLRFTQDKYTIKRPFFVIADFETYLTKPDDSVKGAVSEHKPLWLSYAVVNVDGELRKPVKSIYGEDCAYKFLCDMLDLQKELEEITRKKIKPLTPDQEAIFASDLASCGHCKREFPGRDLVRHHCHISGLFLSALCQPCNFKLSLTRELVIGFHYGSKYDFKLLIRSMIKLGASHRDINVLAKSSEDFICIEWNRMRIIDTWRLLPASLSSLCKTTVCNLMTLNY